jgi:hypothetical protein
MRLAPKITVVLLISGVSFALSGCAFDRISGNHTSNPQLSLPASDGSSAALDVRFGRSNQFLDSAGWVFGIPRKLLLWDRRVDNHNVGDETTHAIAEFANAYELDGLCVRVNQYDPLGEFSRLRTNQTVAPGWRYTFGTMRVIGYTVVPGRIFGGDQYNPYTNSVYVYSDVPALAVEATAYAKDVTGRSWPGTYAAVNELPFVSIWHETVNVRDAVAFVEENSTDQERLDGLRVLHANYGSTVAVATGAGPIAQVGAAVAGQFTGRFQASRQRSSTTESADTVNDDSEPQTDHAVRLASASQTVE